MYLKSINLKGFKSFPERLVIPFEPGITSIVGPNGSGKSNILDAVRWVLAEPSMKNLRLEKQEDVIFSGTEQRKELNSAQVGLLIDNQDQRLPVEFSEIEIKRKVYRSGESEFTLNGKVCRLRDIREILLDTGIGREGYSIISQGRVDEIVQANSQQRRKIIEEASGITRFRYRKEESERNVLKTQQNLERIQDIFSELDRQIGPLETQKEKALRYQELASALRRTEINYLLRQYQEKDQSYRLQKEEQERLERVQDHLDANERQLQEKERSLQAKLSSLRENQQKHQEALQHTREEIAQLQKEREISAHKKQFLEIQTTQKKEEKTQREQNARRLHGEWEEIQIALQAEDAQIQQIERDHQQALQEEKQQQAQAQDQNRQQGQLQEQAREWLQEKTRLLSRQEILQSSLQSMTEKDREFSQAAQETQRKLQACQSSGQNLQSQMKEILQSLTCCEEERLQSHQQREKCLHTLAQMEQSLQSQRRSHQEFSARRSALEKMEEEMQGLARGVKNILQNGRLSGIYDAVVNLIQVKPGYEKAIEAALGPSLSHIVTKDRSSAKQAIEFLKQQKLGRVSFIPLQDIKPRVLQYSQEGMIAVEAVRYDAFFEPLVKFLLGRIVLVKTLEEGIQVAAANHNSFKIVTQGGDVFHAGGTMTGGFAPSAGILSRRKSIQDCLAQETLLQSQMKQTQEALTSEQERLESAQQTLLQIEARRKDFQNKKDALGMRLQKQQLDYAYLEKEASRSSQEQGALKTSIEEAVYTLEKEKKRLLEIDSKNQEVQEALQNLQLQGKRFSEESLGTTKRLQALSIALSGCQQRRLAIDKDEKRLAQELQKEQATIKQLSIEVTFNQQAQETLFSRGQTINEQIENSLRVETSLQKSLGQEAKELGDAESQLRAVHQQSQDHFKEHQSQTALLQSIRSSVEKLSYQMNLLTEKIQEEYQMDLDQAKALYDPQGSYDRQSVTSLKEALHQLGPVNIEAIGQYQELQERHRFYQAQKEDLEQAQQSLRRLIAQLEKNMAEEFTRSFALINQKFNEVFGILFQGGQAMLSLTDQQDLIHSQVEIHVQPPGKKIRHIQSLSGGEKALCAIALIFAILMLKPVPFCILDEIDAPLDDYNISRFVHLLEVLSRDTQFIFITHRRGTMEASDFIYGVTMEEKGISKILGLTLQKADAYVEN